MKKKLIPIIISAVMLLAGCASTVFGVAKNNGAFSGFPELDPFGISDDDVGKTFSGGVYADVMPVGDTENGRLYLLLITDGTADEFTDVSIMCFDVPESAVGKFDHADGKKISFCGTVRKCGEELTEKIRDFLFDYFEMIKPGYEEFGLGMEIYEQDLNESLERISPYYIEAADAVNGNIYIRIGCAVIAVSVFMLLAILFGRRFLIAFALIAVLPAAILLIVFADKLRTMASVTEISDGLYTMTCHYDYKCDKFLDADISTIDGLVRWIGKELFFGLPIEYDAGNFGCSAFTAETPEGQRLFGRNFDYDDTDTLVIYTEPKDGYASYGVVDLRFFDIGTENGTDGNSIPAKALMLCAPYVTMDGINEAGVGAAILQLDIAELHQDNGNTDLLITSAIRGILDKCADVDEALALLENYDIHSFLSRSYHLFITDKTGRSVIVEWTDSETFIVEDTACTNDVMSDNEFYDPEWNCERYNIIKDRLSENNGILTKDEAMSVAADAKRYDTEWSCVYDLGGFALDICIDGDYETKYSFAKEAFR